MNQNERVLVATMAQMLIQTTLEFAFHRKQFGDVALTGHPTYEASVRKFDQLNSDLEKSKAEEETQATDLSTLLQSVLTGVKALRRS